MATATATVTDHRVRHDRAAPHRVRPCRCPWSFPRPAVRSPGITQREGPPRRSGSGPSMEGGEGVCGQALAACCSELTMRTRSSSDRPPQTPYGSRARSACSRQRSITGHVSQMAMAACSRRRRRGPRSPSGWKNRVSSRDRQAPWCCHSHRSATGPGSLEVSVMSCSHLPSRDSPNCPPPENYGVRSCEVATLLAPR